MITNGASGDLSIDLSAFGVTQSTFGATSGVGVIKQSTLRDASGKVVMSGTGSAATPVMMQDTGSFVASNGKTIEIQIVGLQDWSLFTAADLIQSPAVSIA
jgi:hypothetical protein